MWYSDCDVGVVALLHRSALDMKWNEWSFRSPLCTYRLNWAKGTSWGWWDKWDDTVLQTQDSYFAPWRSETEHATYRSRRLPQYRIYVWAEKKRFLSLKLEDQSVGLTCDLRLSRQATLTTPPGYPAPDQRWSEPYLIWCSRCHSTWDMVISIVKWAESAVKLHE